MTTALTAIHDWEIALVAVVDVFTAGILTAGTPMGLLLALTHEL